LDAGTELILHNVIHISEILLALNRDQLFASRKITQNDLIIHDGPQLLLLSITDGLEEILQLLYQFLELR